MAERSHVRSVGLGQGESVLRRCQVPVSKMDEGNASGDSLTLRKEQAMWIARKELEDLLKRVETLHN
jgi:hypothetical protein